MMTHGSSKVFLVSFVSSTDVNPDHHVKILEALITVGGLTEMQAAPGRRDLHFGLKYTMNRSMRRFWLLVISFLH